MLARQSVELADRSEEGFRRTVHRTSVGQALHAMGRQDEAEAHFEEAAQMQREMEPDQPFLYSLQGFLYCDFLLDHGRDCDVRRHATQALKIAQINGWILAIALDHLSLGRANLLGAQRSAGGDLARAASHLDRAVDGLRRSGHQDHLPGGLLARAALHTHTRAFALAREDLTETLEIAEHCGFRLHECDAHLGYARLALAEVDPAAALDHLAKARAIVEETGYHRRDGALVGLEAEVHAMPPPAPDPPPPPHAPIDEEKPAVTSPAPAAYDIAIVCALLTPELEKVLATGKQPWTKLPVEPGEITQYRTTTFDSGEWTRPLRCRRRAGPDGHDRLRRPRDEDGPALQAQTRCHGRHRGRRGREKAGLR